MSDNWSAVGWQGVSLRVPPDWNLVGVNGDVHKGYFRVDSPENASVEVRWSVLQQEPTDLSSRGEEFLGSMRKTAKKRKIQFSGKVKSRKPTQAEQLHGGGSVSFTWRADRSGHGRLSYCGCCKRLVIAQVVGDVGRDMSGLAAQILGSICSHEEPGWNEWALYDLHVAVPERFKLAKHTLMSSFVELEFKDRRERMIIQRWGLAANTLLKKQSLEEWMDGTYLPGVTGYRTDSTRIEGSEHEEFQFKGRRRGIHRAVLALGKTLVKAKPLPRFVEGRTWYCDETNRIYAIRHYFGREGGLVDVLRRKTACH